MQAGERPQAPESASLRRLSAALVGRLTPWSWRHTTPLVETYIAEKSGPVRRLLPESKR
jgi:hypothetical protein